MLDRYEDATICQIAAEIEREIECEGRFNCELCKSVFKENEKVQCCVFRKPCQSTAYICRIAHKYTQLLQKDVTMGYELLLNMIFEEIDVTCIYRASNFQQHPEQNHEYYFVKTIVEDYVRKRATYLAREITLALQKSMCRQKCRKIPHFMGQ